MTPPARVRGGYPDPSLLALPGVELLRAMIEGRSPGPPIGRLTGLQLVEIDVGRAVFELPMGDWLCSPQGAISIGPLTIPADAAMGCAIQTGWPPATQFATSELSLRLLAPARPAGRLRAEATLIQARRTIALAEASLTDERGTLIAHGSTLCLTQPHRAAPPDGASRPRRDPGPETAEGDRPDPWQLPVDGRVIEQPVWDRMTGLEVLEAQMRGELPAPPVAGLFGLRLADAAAGKTRFELPASEWLCAPAPGRVQGGAVALLAEAALSGAIQTTLPAGTALAPIDLKVNYLRPLPADGRVASARGTVVHAGRRIAVASAEVMGADGRAVAVATGSAMILPGRPASLGAVEP